MSFKTDGSVASYSRFSSIEDSVIVLSDDTELDNSYVSAVVLWSEDVNINIVIKPLHLIVGNKFLWSTCKI